MKKDRVMLIENQNKKVLEILKGNLQEDIHLEEIQKTEDLEDVEAKGALAIIIGSANENPIQTAQLLHNHAKNAPIIILAPADRVPAIKKSIMITPYIGLDVECLDETQARLALEKIKEAIETSQRGRLYRNIIQQSNKVLEGQNAPSKPYVAQNFVTKLMDIAPIGIVIIDHEDHILGWNKEATNIFKKPEASVLSQSFASFFPPDSQKKLNSFIEGLQPQRQKKESLRLERFLAKGERQVLNIHAASFKPHGKHEDALILTINDITSNVELLEKIQKEVESRDQFISIASHELRTPLTAMRLKIEFLDTMVEVEDSTPLDAQTLKELLQDSLAQTERLEELIEDLFDVAKIRAGKFTFSLERFNLSEMVKDFARRMAQKFESSGCSLNLDIAPNVEGNWDRKKLNQVLTNLTENAMKYASESEITISLKKENNMALLAVSDTGPGISYERQQKIFGRYEGDENTNISGLGIGLFLTKKIVEGHQGEVLLKSSPGKGAKFIAKLPIK